MEIASPQKKRSTPPGEQPQIRSVQLALLLGSLLVTFLIIESCYRWLDPFPFFNPDESNDAWNLSAYDEILGWRGVAGGKAEFIDSNNRILLAHNSQGYRDVEHDELEMKKPIIVFLGDSFTWGYEVAFEDMFVNRLRGKLKSYTLVNLAHPGYGSDQNLLTFKKWCCQGPVRKVVLMFCENDVDDNKRTIRYGKQKPAYQIVDGRLVLTNVPVPRLDERGVKDERDDNQRKEQAPSSSWGGLKHVLMPLMHSHFLHDIAWRTYLILRKPTLPFPEVDQTLRDKDLLLTSLILRELKNEVEKHGASLLVVFIPGVSEIEQLTLSPPYQIAMTDIASKLDIDYVDLAPQFKAVWRRTYYRIGMHWNAYGNELAAEVLKTQLHNDPILVP